MNVAKKEWFAKITSNCCSSSCKPYSSTSNPPATSKKAYPMKYPKIPPNTEKIVTLRPKTSHFLGRTTVNAAKKGSGGIGKNELSANVMAFSVHSAFALFAFVTNQCLIESLRICYDSLVPGNTFSSTFSREKFPSESFAAKIIPLLSTPLIVRGARLVTNGHFFPINSSGV